MKRSGFTLVELLVSIAILCLITAGMYYAFGAQLRIWDRIVVTSEEHEVANLVLGRICRDTRAAEGILAGSDSTRLILDVAGQRIEYALSEAKVKRKIDHYTTYLTDKGQVSHLSFAYPAEKQVRVKVGDLETRVCLRN